MEIRNIAIVTHLFYPQQTPRALRATELAKELSRQGYFVTVYCLTGGFDYTEFEINNKLKVRNIGNPRVPLGHCNTQYIGKQISKRNNKFTKIKRALLNSSRYLIGFPESELTRLVKRVIVRDSVKFDLIISIGRPYEIHWGITNAKMAMSKFPIWISDCGDPFMGNPFSHHPFYFKWVEKRWSRLTDIITIPIESAKDAYYPEFREKVVVIPQGFDFSSLVKETYSPNPVPTFVYAGALYPGLRDPSNFLKYLCALECDFKFIVYTQAPDLFIKYKDILNNKLEVLPYIPRLELVKVLSRADFLINIQNTGKVQSPSKLIDYYYVERPILNIDSSFHDDQKAIFNSFISGDFSSYFFNTSIEPFKIENVAKQFIEIAISMQSKNE